jgi:hypothetical protein
MNGRPEGCDPSRLGRLLDGDLPPAEQAAIDEHLTACWGCRERLERLAADGRLWDDLRRYAPTVPPGGSPGGEGLDFLAPPTGPGHVGRFGPYEVEGVLGRGGMGVVLKARDPALGRPVAIKVLAVQLATSPEARLRFAREARAAAAVVHDHVVAIYAVDEAGGLPYLVMPYLAGASLQDRIDRGRPAAVEEILRIGMQAASGLAAAHAQGLVHRDIKPANILLEDGVERVKITDFGLARAADDVRLTGNGVLAGTPEYMSPEQARGEPVDARSDLFSLGGVLYALATGHAPFRADSALGVLRRVCDEAPKPVREINPAVPDWLAAVIERLMAKDPADRYRSAAEVADLLGRGLAEVQGPGARPAAIPSVATPVAPRWRGRGLAAAILVVAAGLLVAAEVAGVTRIAEAIAGRTRRGEAAGRPAPPDRPLTLAPVDGPAEPDPKGPPTWVTLRGRVIESPTGVPVAGALVQYRPRIEGNSYYRRGVSYDEVTTDADGRFRLRALPGPGSLVVHGPAREFLRHAYGGNLESDGAAGGLRYYAAAVVPVWPEVGDGGADLTVTLRRGVTVRRRVVGPDSRPLARGRAFTSLAATRDAPFLQKYAAPVVNGDLTLVGCEPGRTETVYLLDAQCRWGATAIVDPDAPAETVTPIRLAPCGTATLRLVSPSGDPAARVEPVISLVIEPGPGYAETLETDRQALAALEIDLRNIDGCGRSGRLLTDDAGRLTLSSLIPGATYRVSIAGGGPPWPALDLVAESGKDVRPPDIVVRGPRKAGDNELAPR